MTCLDFIYLFCCKFTIKDFLSKSDQIRSFLRIWTHLLKKSLMENFIFYAVWLVALCLSMYDFLVDTSGLLTYYLLVETRRYRDIKRNSDDISGYIKLNSNELEIYLSPSGLHHEFSC